MESMTGSAGASEVKEVEVTVRKDELASMTELTSSLQQNNFANTTEREQSLRARYSYGIIFLLMNLCAWFVRDYGQKVFPHLRLLKACDTGGRDCIHTMGVLRVSLGCFIFFIMMFVTTSSTSKLHEARNAWHSEWWPLKSLLLVVSLVVPFFFSSDLIQIYGEIARIGAGIFLILQLISVIQFISWWNNYWKPNDKRKRSCFFGLFMSTLLYIVSICGIVLMYSYNSRKAASSLNIFFITWTAILLIVMMVISLHSKVDRGLLSSGIMASYIVFLCWSAIRSEPANGKWNPEKKQNKNDDWETVLSFLIAICAIVMATFSTGIDSQSFQFKKDENELEDDIPYKYGFFHLIFSLGAMYFAMLFINWNLYSSTRKWSIDVGWASTWVKIISEWFAATIYLWKLVSPIVRQSKIMDQEESSQQMQNSHSPSQIRK